MSGKTEEEDRGPKRSPSIFEQTSDLRKEMEMTEHHETCDEVANRYETSIHNGLTAQEAKKVRGGNPSKNGV